jgi:uncharacterized protein (DUF2126 family)
LLPDPALERRRRTLAQRTLEIAARQPVSDPRAIPPLGLRLPIASLPHIPAEEYPYIVEQDPLEPRDALPVYDGSTPSETAPQSGVQEQQLKGGGVAHRDVDRDPRWHSLRIHAAGGKARDYLELVTAVEATPRECRCRSMSRAIRRRSTPRVEVIKVTPIPA